MKLKNHILELWIIKLSGIPLIHAIDPLNLHQTKADKYLFSAVFSAIQTVASQGLQSINMKNTKLIILHTKSYLIASITLKNSNESRILRKMNAIKQKFDPHYQNSTINQDGATNLYSSFYLYLEQKGLFRAKKT